MNDIYNEMGSGISIELDYNEVEKVTKHYLLSLVTNEGVQMTSDKMVESLHRVIAFLSVPGTYMNGQYDTE